MSRSSSPSMTCSGQRSITALARLSRHARRRPAGAAGHHIEPGRACGQEAASSLGGRRRAANPRRHSARRGPGAGRGTSRHRRRRRARQACHTATGGTPFLLHSMLVELEDQDGEPSASALEDVPDIECPAISRSVIREGGTTTDEAGQLAAAVAVWGTRPKLVDAADLAGIDHDVSARAADSLAAAGLIGPNEPLEFVHPVVYAAVYNSIPAHRRSLGTPGRRNCSTRPLPARRDCGSPAGDRAEGRQPARGAPLPSGGGRAVGRCARDSVHPPDASARGAARRIPETTVLRLPGTCRGVASSSRGGGAPDGCARPDG